MFLLFLFAVKVLLNCLLAFQDALEELLQENAIRNPIKVTEAISHLITMFVFSCLQFVPLLRSLDKTVLYELRIVCRAHSTLRLMLGRLTNDCMMFAKEQLRTINKKV